jgi:hypothetical protein
MIWSILKKYLLSTSCIYTSSVFIHYLYVRTYTELLLLSLRCELSFVCFVFGAVLRALLARSLAASANSLTEEEGRRPGAQEIRGVGSATTRKKCGR